MKSHRTVTTIDKTNRDGRNRDRKERSRSRSRSRNRNNDDCPRDWKELFVGNVITGITENELKDFLNASMRKVGLARSDEHPVVRCRMSAKFSFIEFNNTDDCTRALNLNGIPLRGVLLKIGRPAKYSGKDPMVSETTWQQLTGEPVSGSSNLGALGEAPVSLGFLTSDQNTKSLREIFIGNINEAMTETSLSDFLGGALRKMGLCNYNNYLENPVLQVRINNKYCFVEMSSPEDAANTLNLDGIPFMGSNLKISRPSKFDGDVVNNSCRFFHWDNLYNAFLNGDVKRQTAGTPSKVIVIVNIASREELDNSILYLDIIQDMRLECSQFGSVISVIIPKTPSSFSSEHDVVKVFIEMSTIDQSYQVLNFLKGRSFNGRLVDIKYYPLEPFRSMNYTVALPHLIMTSKGTVTIDKVLNKNSLEKIKSAQYK